MTERPRLVLLTTTPRVAAGLLSGPAWHVLREADAVLTGEAEHPLLGPLNEVGIAVTVVAGSVESRARRLLDGAAEGCAVWLVAPDGEDALAGELSAALQRMSADSRPPEVELLRGSWDLPGARLLGAVAVMDRLRSPGGCPWDARQTHESLVPYLVEEAYEAIEAIESADRAGLREELGDLLLQVLFHARIAAEDDTDPWTIDEVADGIVAKLVARHPHVFAGGDAATAEQVEANWHLLKQAEKGRESATDGIPMNLPALVLAAKLLARAERAGVAVPPPPVPLPEPAVEEELGALLLALVARAQERGWDAERALRAAVRRHRTEIRTAEGLEH